MTTTARVSLDLLGGDRAPEAVVDGALLALHADPALQVVLVGPPALARGLLEARGAAGACEVVPASQVVTMGEDAARAVRAKRDATVRVAARLVRDGAADAVVSVGATGAAMAAALFAVGRLPGLTRPALAVVVPALHGPLVLLDVGANVECTPDLLAQWALAGSAFAQVRLGLDAPRVALLSVAEEPGKGDPLRRQAHDLFVDLPLRYVGSVEGRDVPLGGGADVVVTDGFTGNVALKTMEGTVALLAGRTAEQAADLPDPLTRAVAGLSPEQVGGAVLLGVAGVCVVGHGSSSPTAVASCLRVAAQAVRERLVERTAQGLSALVSRRRAAAGLGPAEADR